MDRGGAQRAGTQVPACVRARELARKYLDMSPADVEAEAARAAREAPKALVPRAGLGAKPQLDNLKLTKLGRALAKRLQKSDKAKKAQGKESAPSAAVRAGAALAAAVGASQPRDRDPYAFDDDDDDDSDDGESRAGAVGVRRKAPQQGGGGRQRRRRA